MNFDVTYQSLASKFLIVALTILVACSSKPQKPDTQSEKYKQAVSNFYLGLAAIQSDHALYAVKKMKQVADIYPAEPAAWANLGVFAMRQGNFELATKQLAKAEERAPDNGNIQFLEGILESRKGNIEAALKHLNKAAKIDSTNPKLLYSLADELERQDPKANAKEIESLFQRILAQDPNNMAVLLERVRTAAKWDDKTILKKSLDQLEDQSVDWPEQLKQRFGELKSTILEKQGGNITFELAFLRNNLNQLSKYQNDLQKVQLPSNQVGFLITHFLWLPEAGHRAESADEQLAFHPRKSGGKTVKLFEPVGLGYDQPAEIEVSGKTATVNGRVQLSFPAGSGDKLSPNAIAAIDYNYDFFNDLAFAGPGGFKLYKQLEDSTFRDVTDSLHLPSDIKRGSYSGIWAEDLDLDGDLDLLLAPENGAPIMLQNNGDDTFDARPYFTDSGPIRDFLWADFDQDGDPDAVLLTKNGELHYYSNRRSGDFAPYRTFDTGSPVGAVTFGDLNSDGLFEIISQQGNSISATGYTDSTASWDTQTLLKLDKSNPFGTDEQIFVSDLDNNAALDLMVTGRDTTLYWLSDDQISLKPTAKGVAGYVYGLGDMDGDNRLDLVGVTKKSHELVAINKGSKSYKARIIRPRASGPLGDRRINSYGIGGVLESRSGFQYSKQPITKAWVHVGLGNYDEAQMVRIIWPNGSTQAEFAELGYQNKIMNQQILKGSCPWVFTYNGNKMEFITDFLWRTALGLRINAQGKAKVIHSIDWIKINGDQLQPRDGHYDVRITADLWETHFFDHVSLMAVDHPANTDVFVDERFKLPAPKQQLYPLKNLHPVEAAYDNAGRDVTRKIARKDGRYVANLPLTSYQGLTKEHYIELDLGKKKTKSRQKLVASGWVYPTDSSINVAISQGSHPAPHGIRLEVPDGKGGWKVAKKNIGFPAGKKKTMLIDLNGIFEPGTPRRVRLYTNMEIYWDQFQLGTQPKHADVKTHRIAASTSQLEYRGYSKLEHRDRFSPTVPDYQKLEGTTQKWRDLVGFYTRYGDVKELTKKSDDRYVIMNAGDELRFKFPALSRPKKGWKRDFVLIGDGWVKDGDYNTGFSKTVLPLPYHGMKNYSNKPERLQDDPVYQQHKQDWVKYHTRYVTPANFNMALRFKN